MPKRFITPYKLPSNNKGIPQIKFELFGDWNEAMKTFARLGPNVKEASLSAQLKLAKEIVRRVKGHLRNQDLGWKELSNEYAKKKRKAGLSSNTLMAYKTYYENIKVWTPGNRSLVLLGVKKGIYTKRLNGRKSKIDVAAIAGIHEFSNGKRLPKRPLWNPTIKELGGIKGIKAMYVKTLLWHLRRKGIRVEMGSGNNLYLDGNKTNPFK
jgi:hypothetical protein